MTHDNDPYRTSSVDHCRLIALNRHHHANGNLTVVQGGVEVPFDLRRVYYIYDIPGGEERGGHSHRQLYQLLVAISGSFDVVLDDGVTRRCVTLNRPYHGLLIVPGIWRVLNNFSSGAVCLCLASEHYDADDYTRSYDDFLRYTAEKQSLLNKTKDE